LPPYDDAASLPTLAKLASEGVVFRQHRATTSTSAGSFASLLTGLSATTHTLTDGGGRLPARFATVATLARDGRAATGMFTGNPTSFETFGFNRGWDRFEAFSPVSGTSARGPMRHAAAWLEERLSGGGSDQILVVVHAQAGHPPWAISPDDLQKLPPEEYTGPIEARRGGQILSRERRRKPGRTTLKAQDRVRIDGYVAHALGQEDAAMTELLEVLRKRGVLDQSLVVITSDVAMGGGSRIPFGDGETLEEDLLEIPLVVRFPDRKLAGQQVKSPTTSVDVARTVLAALQLDAPVVMGGRDLLEVATHPDRFAISEQFAALGPSYATRWGDLLLSGSSPQRPTTCNLAVTDDCEQDETSRVPFLASFLWRRTYDHYRDPERLFQPTPSREPATLDPDTVSALTVWGNLESK
jgi:arylsulfatase A-like enzyme